MIGILIGENAVGYQVKDAEKFKNCNKLISRGMGSSGLYAEICEGFCNVGFYVKEDTVGISVNGKRSGRTGVDPIELGLAMEAGATLITDNSYHRARPYNIGEREVAKILVDNNYREIGGGVWQKQ